MRTALIYARISQDRTGAELGVERQIAECQEYASAQQLQVMERLTDNDISAYSGKPRPGYQRLLERIRDGKVDVVLVWHTDRLHRSPTELEEYIDASNIHGVRTLTVRAGVLDLATPTGRLMARHMGSYARYESEQKGERVRAKRRQAALTGKWQGGPRPFGWEITNEPDESGRLVRVVRIKEDEAELVRWAFRAVLDGKSISGLVAHFQRSGVLTTQGNGWRHSSMRNLLQRTRNCGIESLKGEEMGPSELPALVDEGSFRAVQRILADPKRRSQDDNRVKRLLSGIARCHCGALMVTNRSSGKIPKPVYVCDSSRFPATRRRDIRHVTRRADEMDAYVEDRWSHVMYNPANALRLHVPASAEEVEVLERELEALRARQNELLEMWAREVLTMAQFSEMNPKLTAQVRDKETQLADLAERGQELPDLLPNQAAAYWQTLDLLEKRELLKQSVEIVCYPTGGRPFSKLENQWKYVQIKARQASDGNQRIIYWKPTVEPVFYETDPRSAGLPSDTPAPWPPA